MVAWMAAWMAAWMVAWMAAWMVAWMAAWMVAWMCSLVVQSFFGACKFISVKMSSVMSMESGERKKVRAISC